LRFGLKCWSLGARLHPMKYLCTLFAALLLAAPIHATGFADGIKIGEVDATSAVVWVRLTERAEADRRIDEWDDKEPKQWSVPGARGQVGIRHGKDMGEGVGNAARFLQWTKVGPGTDFCHQFQLRELVPDTVYRVLVRGRAEGGKHEDIEGTFRTAPPAASSKPIRFIASTCQDFPRRDDPKNGHKIYKSMLALKPAFFVQTGDTLYYDKPKPYAKDLATARYKWNRFYAMPYPREFHKTVPSYWLHDDHDVLKNDCWPGQKYGELTWEQGLQVWREQIPQSEKPYRTFRWGKNLQVWFPEGREFRSANPMPDGPNKSILGAEQWAWLRRTMTESDATFKLFVSATPVVGPDRKNKKDNHANQGFSYEGKILRKFLSGIPGCFVINGDRHWQYHSVDPETGLQEFGSGPASDKHAGGWKYDLKPDWQKFLRIKGGFLSVNVEDRKASFRHHDVDGEIVHEVVMER
jgi:alkaline phosphatase D